MVKAGKHMLKNMLQSSCYEKINRTCFSLFFYLLRFSGGAGMFRLAGHVVETRQKVLRKHHGVIEIYSWTLGHGQYTLFNTLCASLTALLRRTYSRWAQKFQSTKHRNANGFLLERNTPMLLRNTLALHMFHLHAQLRID